MFRLARVGDKDSQGNTIVEGSSNMKDQGLPVARVGDKLSDGSVITTGNPTIMVDGKPAAIVGSQVSNGNTIIGPCSTKVTTGFQVGVDNSQPITPTNLQAAGFNPKVLSQKLFSVKTILFWTHLAC
ncbi:PAAR domain-containing protein [Zooshikella sp. RANM57]|uniref:PAAR domain-containing protein n=1 Tax=Zooshikella sp. RANM57 TaxID=3425863 RepID=UPI003D6F8339